MDPLNKQEHLGRALAAFAKHFLQGEVVDRPIVILAGKGESGGSGLAAARQLFEAGAWVQTLCAYPAAQYRGRQRTALAALQALAAPLAWAEEGWELPACDLLIDTLIGCGLQRAPRGRVRDLILLANSHAAPILSLDAPSGMDCDTGRIFHPHIRATATLIAGLPKPGIRQEPARAACGEVWLADVGLPSDLYAQQGIDSSTLFARDSIAKWTY